MYTKEIEIKEAEELLESQGLSLPKDVDFTLGLFDGIGGGELIGTASL